PHRVVEGPAVGRACRHHLVEQEGDAASGALHLRQAGIEHLPRRDHRHFRGHRLGWRHALHDHGELVCWGRAARFARAEDRLTAVAGKWQLVTAMGPGGAKALDDLLPRPAGHQVDMLDRIGIAHADDADIALADLARAFELYAQFVGRHITRPGDPDCPLVILLVAAVAHIDMAAEEVLVER